MTLVETVIAAFLLGLMLLVTAEGADYIRNQLKTARTWELLARLDEALSAYHHATGEWPGTVKTEGPATIEEDRGSKGEEEMGRMRDEDLESTRAGTSESRSIDEGERAAERVIAAMRQVPASGALIERILADAPGGASVPAIRDAWGRPLRCLTVDSFLAVDRLAVAAHGGRPIFISAGPAGATTNRTNAPLVMRSDELPR